jgi:deoxyadenosine/deoxycytidine kinase
MNHPLIISVEGNIGIGKSTLLDNIETYTNNNLNDNSIIILREPVDEWLKIKDSNEKTILSHFYEDPDRYRCSFQLIVLKTMNELLSETIKNNPNCKLIICERSVLSCYNVFAKMMLNEIELKIFESFYSQYNLFIPHKIVYLETTAITCSQRIEKRNRECEQNIELDYLIKCEKYHQDWLNTLLQEENVKIKIMKININSNINYNLNDGSNMGLIWIKQILEFSSSN